jgi:hypothetical protein
VRKHVILLAAAVLATAGNAMAADINYSYLQGDLLLTRFSDGLKYRDIDEINAIVNVSVGFRVRTTPRFSVGVDLTDALYIDSDEDPRELFASLNFRLELGSK